MAEIISRPYKNVSEVPIASVVVPAHNEEAVIERTLNALLEGSNPGQLEIVVVCNGCTDRTVEIVEAYGRGVRVMSLKNASKTDALNRGDQLVTVFPRIYLDADVTLTFDSIIQLIAKLRESRAKVAVGHMDVDMTGRGLLVRSFYRVWSQHPYFDQGKFGGVYAISAAGHRHLGRFPGVTADDEYVRRIFTEKERVVVDGCRFTVSPPRHILALIRIRSRIRRGTNQLKDRFPALPGNPSNEAAGLLPRIARQPQLWLAVPVYCTVVIASVLRAYWSRLNHTEIWERDDTSRDISPSVKS